MADTKNLKSALGKRFLSVIAASKNPQLLMDEIVLEAERRDLIDSGATIRRDSPETFVEDLWTENPVILDRLNLTQDNPIRPIGVKDLQSVIDALP